MPADVELPFTRAEYDDRLLRTRAAMGRAGIGVLVVTDPANMAWLSGYDAWSFYTHQALVVSDDDDPVYWGRALDAHTARRTVWMDESHIVTYPDDLVQSPDRHPMEHLADVLAERGLRDLPVAVELDGLSYSAAADRTLRAALGRPDLVDATGLVNRRRAVKSPRELELMRIAARILERVHARVREVAQPGMRTNDLVAEIYHAAISGTPEHGGDYPAIVPLVASGAAAAAPHLTWDDAPLERGAATFLELGACHRRYHAVASRSLYVGEPPDAIRRAERALLEALDVGIDVARAGNRAGDVADAVDAALRRNGIDRRGARCGYPVGLGFPPDWGERTTSLRTGDPTVLEPGMTFHLMPGLWTDDWGLEITETVVVRDGAPAECLAEIPRALVVVP